MILKYHAACCIWFCDGMSVSGNIAILIGYQTANDFQKRALSAAAVSHNCYKFAFLDGKIDIFQYLKGGSVFHKFFVQV